MKIAKSGQKAGPMGRAFCLGLPEFSVPTSETSGWKIPADLGRGIGAGRLDYEVMSRPGKRRPWE